MIVIYEKSGERKNRRTEEQINRGTVEQKNRGTEEIVQLFISSTGHLFISSFLDSAEECVQFEKESFGALNQKMSSLSDREKESVLEEMERELQKFE